FPYTAPPSTYLYTLSLHDALPIFSCKFQSNIILFRRDGARPFEADARSILSILLLSAGYGSTVGVRATGEDEDQAVESICEYLRSEEHTSELQSRFDLVCRLLLEK